MFYKFVQGVSNSLEPYANLFCCVILDKSSRRVCFIQWRGAINIIELQLN